MTSAPKISVSRVQQALQNRINYIRYATPERVGWLLDQWYQGGFAIAELWETIERRHPHTAAVVGKRKADVGRMDWQILKRSELEEGQEAEADRHAEVLKGFYDTLSVTSALKQDESGGVGLLAQQMLDARGKEFSVHEWIWRLPRGGSPLTAEFRHCPLWWFENRSGRVRYLPSDGLMYGIPMDPAEWLVTVAPVPLMEPTCVCWLFAHASLNDWLSFCDRFGMPGLLGKTDAQIGSPEWDAMETAVKSFGQDWAAVVNREAGIEAVQISGGSTLPYQPLVDMMHRTIATLWRGGDLSTMSSTQGQGQGASVQDEEGDLLQQDDARFISEKLQERVDRRVIEYYFGPGTQPLAYFQLQPPTRPDTDRSLKVDEFFLRHRLPLSRADAYERYGRTQPAPDAPPEDIIAGSAAAAADPLSDPNAGPQPMGLANAVRLLNAAADHAEAGEDAELRRAAQEEIAAALGEALAPLRSRLSEIAEMEDPILQQQAMNALRTELPDILRRAGKADADLAQAIEGLLGASAVNGLIRTPQTT